MISSVSGTLQGTGADWVEIGVGGVTLRVHVPDTAVGNVGRVGEGVRVYTSLQVREDSLTLFGFPTDDERQTFETAAQHQRDRAAPRSRHARAVSVRRPSRRPSIRVTLRRCRRCRASDAAPPAASCWS